MPSLISLSPLLLLLISIFPSVVLSAELVVDVSGIDSDEKRNVLQSLSIAQLTKPSRVVDKVIQRSASTIDGQQVNRLPRLHKIAVQEIRSALQPFGYYQPIIISKLTQDAEVWRASYKIDKGLPVLIDSISIGIVGEGKNDASIQQVLRKKPFNVNDRLNHQNYSAFKSTVVRKAVEQGYLDSRFITSALSIDLKKNKAFIEWMFNTGPKFYFGEINFEQNILDEALLDQYIPFEPGDVFNSSQLISLQLALGDSQYFDRVDISADRELAVGQSIPVLIEAVPAKPRQYTLGFGYGTDTGLRAKLGTVFKRVNRRGHRVRTDFLISEIKRSAAVNYEIPLGQSGNDSLRFLSRYEKETVGDGDAERVLVGASYNDTWRRIQRRLYLNYAIENSRFGTTQNTARFLTPGITLSYAKADNVLLPRAGYSWTLNIHGASDTLLSDASFLQGRVVGQRVWSPGERWRVLSKIEFGATRVDRFEDLPTTSRFFAGGDRSVRGYRYQSFGADDDQGNTIGGQYLAAGSLEADYLFYKDFGGAVFIDSGDAALSTDFQWHRGVGVGLRWRSPVGMFRLDLASPIDDEASSYRVHISIGADL